MQSDFAFTCVCRWRTSATQTINSEIKRISKTVALVYTH